MVKGFRIKGLLFWLAVSAPVMAWQSAMLSVDSGELVYHADADGFVLPDFSHAGYMGGDADLPDVPVVRTVTPVKGDNTAHLQAAIDTVGAMPIVDGIRGALLIKAGRYEICGTLTVPYDGVVLRGEEGTVLHATGDTPHQRDVLVVGGTSRVWGGSEKKNTRQAIIDETVVPGAMEIHVADASCYRVGQPLIIYHPCTPQWLAAVDYGGVPYPDPTAPDDADERWSEGQYPVTYHRYITAIQGNTVMLDAPVFYTLRRSLAASYVYEPNMKGTVYGSGIENLTIEIESLGGEDENHAWNAVRFRSIENGWAVGCTFSGFGQSGIVTEACRRSSFISCSAVDPVGITTGERKYNFNTYLHSQLNLFRECYARAGRHNYISNGTSGTSGNVFLQCVSDGALNVNEGHRGWTQGMLYDNHRDINMTRPFTLGLYNRVAMGTGHGWAAVQSVLWNCDVDAGYGTIGLQRPPTSQNYAIGCHAKKITGHPVNASDFPLGYVEGRNTEGLEPQSLYLAQWMARHGMLPTGTIEAESEARCFITNQGVMTADAEHLILYTPDGRVVLRAANLRRHEQLIFPTGAHGIFFVWFSSSNGAAVQKILL